MKIHTDHIFLVGKDHSVCEDYAMSGNSPRPYIILSDGCSTGDHTDIGSRILSNITKAHINYEDREYNVNIERKILYDLVKTMKYSYLKFSSLYSTLLFAYFLDKYIIVVMYGDGNLIFRDEDNKMTLLNIDYTDNQSPDYIIYNYSEKLKKDYRNHFPFNQKNIFMYDEKENLTTEIDHKLFEPIIRVFDPSEIKSISLLSDGMETFSDGYNTYDKVKIANQISSFKNFRGCFVKRRVKRLVKNLSKKGFNHRDDLSMVSIYIED